MFGIEKDFQNLMEQVYGPHYGFGRKVEEESAKIAKQLVDNAVEEVKMKKQELPDTIEIGGVKYQRVYEPPTLSNKLGEWIETLNFAQSKEHKDLLVIEILNIVKEFIPECKKGMGLPEYCVGWNDAIKRMNEELK
jgi:hypothetical protein